MLRIIGYGLSWVRILSATAADVESQMGISAINRREAGMKTDDVTAQSTRQLTDLNEAKTLAVPEAGRRYFNLGRNASYEAAKRGDLPVIRIGSRLRVPVVVLERMLTDASRKDA
jgi:hypothetical protein